LSIRHAALGPIQMPPLAKNVVDAEAVQVIADWIESLADAPTVKLDAPATAGGNFQVGVTFSASVTGLETGDFNVAGGNAVELTGSGADYTLTVAPSDFGDVAVALPAGRATDAGGHGNYASATAHVVVSDPGLITWLRFDEETGATALDSTARENHGTLIDMEPADRTEGLFGGALHFDSSGERVTVSNVATDDFTISFWFRADADFPLTDFPPGGHALAHADAPGPQPDFMITGTRGAVTGNRITFQTGHANGSPNTILFGSTPVATGAWTHVAVTRERSSGAMAIYVNGTLDASTTGSTAALTANSLLSIGGNASGAGFGIDGLIDQFRIHDRVLTPAEILALAGETDEPPPYRKWLDQWLPGLTHLHDPAFDLEPDGISNFGEFAFGGNPLAWDVISTPLTAHADGSFTISFAARRDGGAAYEVEMSVTLGDWTPAEPFITSVTREPIAGTDYETVTITCQPPEAEPAMYFRVRADP
ncbi:MAG: hypothetical protein KDN05_22900, partial [Verrucomicrobiae bacterium]|nr:hypothetical protein [Verrucomicrobiae bacterium]